MSDFKKDAKKALANLENATGWKVSLDEDMLVHVEREPSKSQKKHLASKAKPVRKPGVKRVSAKI